MGMVHAEITLKNVLDEGNARSGLIKPESIRTATVTAVVDTGAMHLVINEELRQKLGLEVKEERYVLVANGQRVRSKVTDAVEVHWKNRETIVQAVVIPEAPRVLMGAIARGHGPDGQPGNSGSGGSPRRRGITLRVVI
jgi:clan AA aspartic protease